MKRGGLILLVFLVILPVSFAFCGDGVIDGDENCAVCPEDALCLPNEKCVESQCIDKIFPPLFLKVDPLATVVVPKEIASVLNSLYAQPNEFAVCLKGRYASGVYHVTEMEFPNIIGQSEFAVQHAKCGGMGLIASVHSHVDGDCDLSEGDIFVMGQRKEPLMGIVCGVNNFAFYPKTTFSNRLDFLIRDIEDSSSDYFWSLFPWVFSILLVVASIGLAIEREVHHHKKNKDLALSYIEGFSPQERKIVDELLDKKVLNPRKIPKAVFNKLERRRILKQDRYGVVLEKWFWKAVKDL